MNSPIHNKINTVFVHVSDLKNSVEWYTQLLGQTYDSEKIEDPVYTIQLSEYTGLTLDAGPAGVTKNDCSTEHPLFNFHTDDIEKSFAYVKKLGYSIETEIVSFKDFSFFTISDPDQHIIMICTG
ncbi:VOC family protein [Metabacillus sp. cB07]|uniref:VOC family protein n=1 Tax=Metabacillus sp. cB07 TaxID=2806989 RepID=UPI001939274D|nr:VOC family protein [Metabacillus sp. cB07]